MIWSELTTGIYPWDIHDEGIENILDNLQNYAGNNAAYMLALMHPEKRPLHANYYPHNPVRKRYIAEDSRCYFTIHPECYQDSVIKPLPSERDFLKDTDWLDVFIKGLRKRGMKTGAEISHTPLDAYRARHEYPHLIQRDIYGNPPKWDIMSDQLLCWNAPEARAYVCAIAKDLATNYDLDMIQTCAAPYMVGEPSVHSLLRITLGGCFCKNCEREARAQGLDWDKITATVRMFADAFNVNTLEGKELKLLIAQGNSSATSFLLEYPELYDWLKFRQNSVTRFIKELSETIHAANPKIDFRLNTFCEESELFGLSIRDVAPYVDSIRVMEYEEQTGDYEKVANKAKWFMNVRRMAGEDKKIIAGIAPRHLATPELIKLGIKQVGLGGADGLSYGFYDGASFENLKAIHQGMEDLNVVIK
ncbi:MAG: hypothetical protein R3Y06_06475 [Faecalibacterium sp.]